MMNPSFNRKLKETPKGDPVDSGLRDLIVELLHAATKTHFIHLKTTSFAAHKALNEFYDQVVEHADSLAEQYQGITETLLDYPIVNVSPINTVEEAIDYMKLLYVRINQVQGTCHYSEIVNELDNVKSLINSTKYKLIFLK